MALFLVFLAASAFAQDLRPVCARHTMDRLAAGTPIGVAEAFLEKARRQVTRERDPMERSPFQKHVFPVIFDQRVLWSDGAQVGVTCTIKASLRQLELKRLIVRRAAVQRLHPMSGSDGRPLGPDWTKYVYELEDVEMQFPASLTCEVEPHRAGPGRPYAGISRTELEIGVLQNLLFDRLPLQIRTETDPARCAALVSP